MGKKDIKKEAAGLAVVLWKVVCHLLHDSSSLARLNGLVVDSKDQSWKEIKNFGWELFLDTFSRNLVKQKHQD